MTADSKQGERDGGSVLSRWSRRKLESRHQAVADELPRGEDTLQPASPASGEASAAAAEEKPVLTDADMPDIDSLDENSDFSPFMSSGVSDRLRNLALRKLFHAPAFNIRDGLDEYDDDFTSFEKLGDIVTSDMKHRIEMEQQKLREKLAEEQSAGDTGETESAELDAVEDIDDIEDQAQSAAEDDSVRLARLDTDGEGGETDKDEPKNE